MMNNKFTDEEKLIMLGDSVSEIEVNAKRCQRRDIIDAKSRIEIDPRLSTRYHESTANTFMEALT
jgi:hypothetical protein